MQDTSSGTKGSIKGYSNVVFINGSNGTFTLKSGNIVATGDVIGTSGINGVYMQTSKSGVFNMEGGTITAKGQTLNGYSAAGVAARHTSKVNITGGTIDTNGFCIYNNGLATAENEKTTISIKGATLTSSEAAGIYQAGLGDLTIDEGTTITGKDAGVEVRAGTITVNGGTIKSSAEEYSVTANGNGSTAVGAGIALNQHTTELPITANIKGGDISGPIAIAIANPQNNDDTTKKIVANISGGTFNSTVSETAIDAQNADTRAFVNITGGTFNNDLVTKLRTGTSASAALGYNISGTSNPTFSTFTYKNGANLLALARSGGGSLYNIGVESWNGGNATTGSTSWAFVAAGSESHIGTRVLDVIGSKSIAEAALRFDSVNSLFGIPDESGGLSSYIWRGGDSYFLATYNLGTNSTVMNITPQTTGVSITGASSIFGSQSASIITLNVLGNSGIFVDASDFTKIKTVTGGSGADTLTTGLSGITFHGGADDDSLVAKASNVSLYGDAGADVLSVFDFKDVFVSGGGGSDTINLLGGTSIWVDVSKGDDIISLGSAIKAFSVSGFDAGDKIELAGEVTGGLSNVGNALVAGTVTIGGFSWAVGGQSWLANETAKTVAYNNVDTIGVALDGKTISVGNTSLLGANLFTLSGIGTSAGVSLNEKVITLGTSAVAGLTKAGASIQLKGKGYSLSLATGVLANAMLVPNAWTFADNKMNFMTGVSSAYYSLNAASTAVSFVAQTPGTSSIILSGALSTATWTDVVGSNSVVNLTKDHFGTNGITVDSYVKGYSFSLAAGDYASGKSFTGSSAADAIYNYGHNFSVFGGSGADSIYNYSGTSVTINVGIGDDLISLVAGTASSVLIDFGKNEGNDTINVAATGVTAFGVSGFAKGDVISFSKSSALKYDGNALVIGDVKISGLSIANADGGWDTSGTSSIFYFARKTVNATWSGTTSNLVYSDTLKTLGGASIFKITGISKTDGVSLNADTKVITLGASTLAGLITEGASIALSVFDGGTYSLSLAAGISTSAAPDNKWTTFDTDKAAYMTGASTAYYVLSDDKKLVTFKAANPGENSVILSGINGTLKAPANSIVGLSLGNFNSSDVSVLGNAVNYSFSIATLTTSNYNGKSFYGMSGNDTIFNYGANLTIYGLSGTDQITNAGANATIYGGDDNDTITNSAATVKIFGDAGADSITNSGENVTIDGGAGNDWISLAGGTGTSVNVGSGSDTISVDNSKVTALSVAGFSKGDLIQLQTAFTGSLSIVGGTLSVGTLKITGIDSVVTIKTGWGEPTTSGSVSSISFNSWSTSGAQLNTTNAKDITWADATAATPIFTLSGIGASTGITFGTSGINTIVTFSKDALIGLTPTDSVGVDVATITTYGDAKNYEFVIDDTMQFASHSAGWQLKTGTAGFSNAIYRSDSSSAGFKIAGGKISYVAGSSTPVTWVELSGIADIAGLSFIEASKSVSINASAFAGASIAIVGNSGAYKFILSGTLTSKSFYGTNDADTLEIENQSSGLTIYGKEGADTIENSGDNVSIYGGGGYDQITNTAGSTVLIHGGDQDDIIQIDNGKNISINGAGGSNVVSLLGGENLFINVSEGADTIYVDATKVTAFSVSGFGTDDLIKVVGTGTFGISSNNTDLLFNNALTISGLSTFALPANDWTNATAGGLSYRSFTTSGATFDNTNGQITWSASSTDYKNLFTITGLSSAITPVSLMGNKNIIGVGDDSVVTLSQSAVEGIAAGNTVSLGNATGYNYSLSLGAGVNIDANTRGCW